MFNRLRPSPFSLRKGSLRSFSIRPNPPSQFRTVVITALTASLGTYLALNGPPQLLLDVFNPEPEPPIVDARFGTVQDFKKAVTELQTVFEKEGSGKDQVSTDPEDLLGVSDFRLFLGLDKNEMD